MENFVTTISEGRERRKMMERKDGGRERFQASFHPFRAGRFIFSFVLSFFLPREDVHSRQRERERERKREKRRLMNIQKRNRGEVSRRQVDSTKKIELLERKREKYKGR